jgi:hypothetical protein
MTRDELQQIQTACHEWLRQAGAANGNRLTIPAQGAIAAEVHLEVRSILTFDNVLIRSAVDATTRVCYTKLIGPHGEAGEFIDTPFEMIAASATRPEPEEQSARDAERESTAEESVTRRARSGAYARTISLIETHDIDGNPRPKYLLYTNGKLLGYSRLERNDSKDERYGRFYPDDDYYEYAGIFGEMVTAENEFLEAAIQEASGLEADPDSKIRDKYNELSDRIEALQFYLTDEDGGRIDASRIKLEDRAHYYGDLTERWLYVTVR